MKKIAILLSIVSLGLLTGCASTGSVTNLATQAEKIKADVVKIEQQVATVEQMVADVNTKVDAANAQVTKNLTEIQRLEAAMDKFFRLQVKK